MIPLALTVRNFLSYGAESQTLDFRGLHVLCLSGENGHGKSALLDAMTWALFGKARANTDDELQHIGATEMQVIFDLKLNDATYRVSRTRTARGKTRLTHLELLAADTEGEWRSLNGNSVRETERAIERLMGMNYQTFINSAFLLQGRADEFTVKPPSERKKVLADVLNLDAYERLANRAKERRNEWLRTATRVEAELDDLDRHIARLPAARAALAEARERRELADAALPPAQALLDQLRAAAERLAHLRQDREQTRQRLENAQAQVRDHRQRRAIQEARLEQALGVLAARADVEREYACWQEQRAIAQDQARRLLKLQPLAKEQQGAQRALERAEMELRRQVAELQGKLQSCIQESARGSEAENQLDGVLAELATLETLPERRRALVEQQTGIREAIAGYRAQSEAADQTLKQLRARYATLGAGDAPCPICEQPLGPQQRARLRAAMKEEADACKAEQSERLAAIARREADLKRLARDVAEADRQSKRLDSLRQTEATLREKARAAECARQQSLEWQAALAAVEQQLAAEDFAREDRRRLLTLADQIAQVAYDERRHREADQNALRLADAEARQRQLADAEQTRRAAEENLEQLRASLASWEAQEHDLYGHLAATEQEIGAGGAVDAEYRRQQAEVETLLADQLAATGAAAAAEADVAQLLARETERQQRVRALNAAQEQQAIYTDLTDAFGRNGVQAMLIDEAIPMIEQEANRLLGAMTDGRLTVALETQRQNQKQETVETLDVRIGDELGVRNYELYSGGEAFRVNFALRIALSRLLAHRAGARLQTLVIDEGFGSQDATGRDRLQAALRSITDDFACIIVITHLDEMKEWFSTRIEVVKGREGSKLTMVAA